MIELPPPMPIVPLSSSSVATSDPCNATTPIRKSSNSEEQVVIRRSFMTSNDRSDTMKVSNTSTDDAGGKVEEARDRLADIALVQEGGDTMGDSLLDESNVESTTSPRMLHHDDLQSSFRSQSSFRLNDNDDNSIVSIPGTVETATSRVSFAGSRSSRQGSESLAKWGKSASSGLSYENDVDSSVNAIVPQLLVQQLIDSLRIDIQQRDEISRIDISTSDRSATSFGEIHTLRDAVAKYLSAGSVQRHRGALLFVDISGFTKLSQNYPVEDFKTFINIYFTKIINLVTSFGGEVVKFAGDALYAIWTTSSGGSSDNVSDNNTDDDTSHAMNIEKCTTCSIAINTECNNYKVSKSYNKRRSSAVSGGSTGSSTQDSLRGQGEVLYRIQDKNTEYEERGSTLTVYCGVSEGIMVGIDVVANNRAEFFLVGRPLKGELVCEVYFKLLTLCSFSLIPILFIQPLCFSRCCKSRKPSRPWRTSCEKSVLHVLSPLTRNATTTRFQSHTTNDGVRLCRADQPVVLRRIVFAVKEKYCTEFRTRILNTKNEDPL